MLTECPRCESPQRFVPKLRDTEHRWQEEYIRCLTCRWEKVIRFTTPEIEMLSITSRKYAALKQKEQERHGTWSGTLAVRHREVRRQWSKLVGELAQEVRAVHGESAHPDAA